MCMLCNCVKVCFDFLCVCHSFLKQKKTYSKKNKKKLCKKKTLDTNQSHNCPSLKWRRRKKVKTQKKIEKQEIDSE